MRRKRVETYFALYLTAIIAFLVVASERDKVEEELRVKNQRILAAFLRAAPVEPERDTLYWNVDADDRTGLIRGSNPLFNTYLRIRDISARDSATITIHGVTSSRSGAMEKSLVKIGAFYTDPNSAQSAICFPIHCRFIQTGTYNVSCSIRTYRIHENDRRELRYKDFVFQDSDIERQFRERVEHGVSSFTVIVQDTSTPYPISVERIAIGVKRDKIVSAVGFSESNEIIVNLPETRPNVHIISGPGTIELQTTSTGETRYFWRGSVRPTPDSVVIEARVARGAGGKDIARTRFYLLPNEPFLVKDPPQRIYAGEEFEMSFQVEGLNNAALYSWSVFINGEKKFSGSSPIVRYAVPVNSENSMLTINGYYDGQTFRCLTRGTNRERESNFSFRIERPPARIYFDPPAEVTPMQAFTFEAVRYGRKRANEKPIPFNEIDVDAIGEDGTPYQVSKEMIDQGKYEFRFKNPNAYFRRSQYVRITVRAAEAIEQATVRVTKK